MKTRRLFLKLLSATVPSALALPPLPNGKTTWEWACMGSRFKAYFHSSLAANHAALKSEIQDLLLHLENTFTVHRPDSEALRLCKAANSSPETIIPVSKDLQYVIEEAQKISVETEGAFDLTIGSLTQYWRYCKNSGKTPCTERLETLKKRVGYKQLRCHAQGISFHPQAGQVLLDFGGIAKGYAADQALKIFKKHGLHQVCIDLGGEILAGDAPPEQAGWEVALTDHTGRLTGEKKLLKNAALSSSGDHFQSLSYNGTHHSHILSQEHPSGLPSIHQALIQAPCALRADALATATRVLNTKG